jgi:hypothetical protein
MHEARSKRAKSASDSRADTGNLPPALRPDGVGQAILDHAKGKMAGSEFARRAVEAWTNELTRLREHCRNSAPCARKGADDAGLKEALNEVKRGSDRHTVEVYRYVLARHLEFHPSDALEETALAEYAARRRAYNRLLCDYIPESVRRAAAEAEYHECRGTTALADWPFFVHLLHAQQLQPLPGLRTGLKRLDEQPGGLAGVTLLAGPPGTGKTSLALHIAASVVEQSDDLCALFLSLEMPKAELYTTLLSRAAEVDYSAVVRGGGRSVDQDAAPKRASETLQASALGRLSIVDVMDPAGRHYVTRKRLRECLERLVQLTKSRSCLVVIDSFQRIKPEDDLTYGDDGSPRARRLADTEADVARMSLLISAQRMTRAPDVPGGYPFLVLSLVRKLDASRRLSLAEEFGSVDLIHQAQMVLLMEPHRERPARPGVAPMWLNIAKVRDTGVCGDVELDFAHTVTRFAERASATPDAPARAPTAVAGKRFAGRS